MACHAGDASTDLLELLHAASRAEAPVEELLRQADHLRWPILAVLAASHPDASASRCMAVWLRATLRSEGTPSAPLNSMPLTLHVSLNCKLCVVSLDGTCIATTVLPDTCTIEML